MCMQRSGAGTTGLNSRLLRGVGSRWQPEKPAAAASVDATNAAALVIEPPAAAADDGQQPAAIAGAVRCVVCFCYVAWLQILACAVLGPYARPKK